MDALALLAAVEVSPERPGDVLRTWVDEREPVRRREGARVVERLGRRGRGCSSNRATSGRTCFFLGEVEIDARRGDGLASPPATRSTCIVVFEGRGTIRVGALEETLEPLKGVLVEMGHPHAITNTGRTIAPLPRLQHAGGRPAHRSRGRRPADLSPGRPTCRERNRPGEEYRHRDAGRVPAGAVAVARGRRAPSARTVTEAPRGTEIPSGTLM